ncbi:MAG: hypothetical protein EA364_11270 [Balneolaceae bacterium]|nr:MAG: hypothetical protein EA364_11270 [Balneolaceae bacterium]
MSNAHIEFLRTRDIGEVLNASMYFIRDHFKPILRSVIYIAGPVLLVVVIISSFYLAGEFSAGENLIATTMNGNILLLFVNNVLAILVTIVIIAIMYEYIFLCYQQGIRAYEVDEVWYAVKKRILLYVMYSVLTGIITFIGFLFLIIPGIYIAVTLSFVYMVAFLEDRSFADAVSRCYEFVQGHWWNTFGLLLLAYVIYYIITMLFSLPALIYGAVIGLMAAGGGETSISYFLSFVINLFSSVSYVAIILPVTALAYQYFNIMERKYAPGLSRDIENLKSAD